VNIMGCSVPVARAERLLLVAFRPAMARGLRSVVVALFASVLSACAPLMAAYNGDAYRNTTSLKAETLALVADSDEPYVAYAAEVKALGTKLSSAYEFAHGLPKNEISAQQWHLQIAPDGALYGGFVRQWQSAGTTGAAYRAAKAGQIGRAFDPLICLDVNKKEPKACSAQTAA
jgi:hypothetical protein